MAKQQTTCTVAGVFDETDERRVSLVIPDKETLACFLSAVTRPVAEALLNEDADEDEDFFGVEEVDQEMVEELGLSMSTLMGIEPHEFRVEMLTPENIALLDTCDLLTFATVYSVRQFGPTWWEYGDAAEHGDDCECGPVSLLEALQCDLSPELRQPAIEAHVAAMRTLYDHFWSGQTALESDLGELGGACPECLMYGMPHVHDVRQEAEEMAVELGEALAAFSFTFKLGNDLYHPSAQQEPEN